MTRTASTTGVLDYRTAATRHRPTYRAGMAAAARDLASQGLRAHDIAQALGITPIAASQLLHRCANASDAASTTKQETNQ